MTGAEPLGRRQLVAGALGAACAVPFTAGCSTTGVPPASERNVRNVREFGAVGDGVADDTAAIAAAVRATSGPVAVYLPAGTYRVTAWPELPDSSRVFGDGGDISTVVCEADTTLITLRGKHRIRFADLGIYLSGSTATAIELAGCFRCSFESMVIRGNHLSSNHPQYAAQRGVVLADNTGGTSFINCDINNFGVGLTTRCIQNYVTASKFASNRIGVLGTGGDHNAGLALTNVEFVSDTDPRTTARHIDIDGAANNWWLTNVWFEGAEVALTVGRPGSGGPSQFGMINCKVAARAVDLDLGYCRQPYLANVIFDQDPGYRPVEVRVSAADCPEGTAINLVSGTAADVAPEVFPPGWHVLSRGAITAPRFSGTVTTRAPDTADAFRVQDAAGAPLAAVLPSGAWLSERAEAGIVLRDADGGYWRLTITPSGALVPQPLGSQRPSR